MKEKSDSFIVQCRINYFLGIRPANQQSKETEGYKELVRIAKNYFDSDSYEDFAENFMEGQYFIPLWAAHLLLEYGKTDEKLKEECLRIISDYSRHQLFSEVAAEEKVWLENYYKA
ncbi:MAG: hypothetical protein JNK14_06185 [Chitinophagaceae bacterium]|nr:hypothetical protein [Chitinophagaceae bacterium]